MGHAKTWREMIALQRDSGRCANCYGAFDRNNAVALFYFHTDGGMLLGFVGWCPPCWLNWKKGTNIPRLARGLYHRHVHACIQKRPAQVDPRLGVRVSLDHYFPLGG